MKLPLALDIAGRVADAHSAHTPLDIAEQAQDLVANHPEAEATVEEVAAVLQEELAAEPLPAL
jgi:hypothetical protein